MRAVAACFDETRAPSWYRSYRPQALGSASTLEAGPTYRATVTPESLQAAGKLPSWLPCAGPCATTLASSYFFCVPFGGRANGRVSRTPRPTPSPTTAAPAPSMRTAPTAARASRLFAHVRRDVQLGIRRRLRRRWPRLGFRPARADGMWDRTIVS